MTDRPARPPEVEALIRFARAVARRAGAQDAAQDAPRRTTKRPEPAAMARVQIAAVRPQKE